MKQEIIEIIDKHTGLCDICFYEELADELLVKIEQEKKDTLKEYAKKLQKAFTGKSQFMAWRCQQIVEYRLRDEYGVKL